MKRKNSPRASFCEINFACHRRPVKLENILCQVHADHCVAHLPSSLLCGLHHRHHAMPLGEDGNHPISYTLLMWGLSGPFGH